MLQAQHQHSKDNYMDGEDQRQANGKFEVAGLMAEQVHTCHAAKASADQRGEHQAAFRDPSQIIYGVMLVQKHNEQACGIDYNEVEKQQLHKITFLEGKT